VHDSKVLAMLQSILSLTEASSGSEDELSYSHQTNSVADQTQLEILRVLKELTQEIKQVKSLFKQNCYSRKTPNRNNKLPRVETNKYY